MTNKNDNKNVPAGGVFYIDYDSVSVFRNRKGSFLPKTEIPAGEEQNWTFDANRSQETYDAWLQTFISKMTSRYKSFTVTDSYIARNHRRILENSMFTVEIEDSGWAFAVELVPRKNCRYPQFRDRNFPAFLNGMCDILLSITDTVYSRTGSWKTQPLSKADRNTVKQHITASRKKTGEVTDNDTD